MANAMCITAADANPMHSTNQILIRAPRERIFAMTTDLARWPEFLPHYRYVRFLEKHPIYDIIEMAASRDGIPISWTSELRILPAKMEMHFLHLRKWTKGMAVVWTYTDTPDGVLVEISHDMKFRFPPLAPLAEPLIGNFIHNIASKTLARFKQLLESEAAK